MKTTHSPFTVGYSSGNAVAAFVLLVIMQLGQNLLFSSLLAGAIVISSLVFEFGGFIGSFFEKSRSKEAANASRS